MFFRSNAKSFCLTIALVAAVAAPAAGQVTVDSQLPTYKPSPGVSGTIKSVGSDTMNNLMSLWGAGFRKFYPNVKIEVEGKGSGTAPPALIAGTATIGPMSRPMKASEIESFTKKFGYKPTQLGTSIDMLAVFVHKDNPVKGLTLPQIDGIFSSTRKLGADEMNNWGELGLSGEWASAPISLYGRNSASGTYGFFKEKALGEGDFKDSVKEQGGSAGVVQAVGRDKFAIGYSGIGFKTPDVRALPLAANADTAQIEPTAENAYSGKYPLARMLLLSVNHKPGTKLDPLRREFLKYIYSKQGQQEVIKDGYFPVRAAIAKKMLAEVGIEQ